MRILKNNLKATIITAFVFASSASFAGDCGAPSTIKTELVTGYFKININQLPNVGGCISEANISLRNYARSYCMNHFGTIDFTIAGVTSCGTNNTYSSFNVECVKSTYIGNPFLREIEELQETCVE
jgi:hypothetical protein